MFVNKVQTPYSKYTNKVHVIEEWLENDYKAHKWGVWTEHQNRCFGMSLFFKKRKIIFENALIQG